MKLNHLGLTVTDVYATRAFLEQYVDLTGLGKNNHTMTHLQDEQGLILRLFKGSSRRCHFIREPIGNLYAPDLEQAL